MADLLVREGEIEFSKPIARAVLRDVRLSFGARGLFVFLWDLPNNWRPNVRHLSEMGPEGKDAVRSRLRELENVGAIRIEYIKNDDGTLSGKRWILSNPQQWAQISSLSPSKHKAKTEEREIRQSAESIDDFSATKVRQLQGLTSEGAANSDWKQETKTSANTPIAAKCRRERNSGIVTWTAEDQYLAVRLEERYPEELLREAVLACTKPLPGIVEAAAKAILRARQAANFKEQICQQGLLQMSSTMRSSPQFSEMGDQFLKNIARKKIES